MNKSFLILKYFQKADRLTTKNPEYCRLLTSLFKWMVQNDKVKSDLTSQLLNIQSHHHARIIARQEAILTGTDEISFLLKNCTRLSFTPFAKDGERIKNGQIVAEITGESREILAYERTVLNILQRLSGIATETNRLIHAINPQPETFNPKLYLAATRKTPWMALDKKAVAVGGGLTHRLSLADGILIKDNHLSLLKKDYKLKTKEAVPKALEMLLTKTRGELIEIEVETEKEAGTVLEVFQKFNTDNHLAIMFDNFSPFTFSSILTNLSDLYDLSSIILEASGGITKDNIHQWIMVGVDLISIGALTHSPHTVNLRLEF